MRGGNGILGGGNSHTSNIGHLPERFDPMMWVAEKTGAPKWIAPSYQSGWLADKGNKYLSPITKPINQFHVKYDPVNHYLDKNVGLWHQWNQTVENRPTDAAGIAAAIFFTGGAAAGAAGGGAAAGAGAAAGEAGAATTGAALAAPAASSIGGIGGMSAGMGASAITPTFASGLGAVGASEAGAIGGGSLLGAAGTGTLGAAGTAALGTSVGGTPLIMGGAGIGAGSSGFFSNPDNIQMMMKMGNQAKDQLSPQQQSNGAPASQIPQVGSSATNPLNTNDYGSLLTTYSQKMNKENQDKIDKLRKGLL